MVPLLSFEPKIGDEMEDRAKTYSAQYLAFISQLVY